MEGFLSPRLTSQRLNNPLDMVDEKGLEIGWPYWPFNLENLISGQAGKIKDKAGLASVGHSGCHQLSSLLVKHIL